MSQTLRDARRFEEGRGAAISPEERPAFHLSARTGWMNDPNGFSFYDGCYHMFYQYHPYDSHWGPMHWGHAVSEDLLHWTYLPVVLAPDQPYDRDGCFSGCGIEMPDGRHMLMYTGVIQQNMADGSIRQIQTQNLAFGDGFEYTKYDQNPVITEKDLPENGSIADFRDPKVWIDEKGVFCMLAANNTKNESSQILLYKSQDGIHWNFDKIFVKNSTGIGMMWECPDFFEIDGKHILLASSQDMLPKNLEYHNGNGNFYLVGNYDKENEDFTPTTDHAVDYGIDFYAPQTIKLRDGRRIMIGWMQNWDTCTLHTKSTAWFGQMSVPRELSLKEDRLMQAPIRELKEYRANRVSYENVSVDENIVRLPGIEGRIVDLELTIRKVDTEKIFHKFSLYFAENDQFHTTFSFRPLESTVKIDRKFSGSRRAIIHQRRARVSHINGTLKVRIILDRFSAEIFVNDGERVLTATIYTDMEAKGISFRCIGHAFIDITKYDLIL